jgi:hypothetical protein
VADSKKSSTRTVRPPRRPASRKRPCARLTRLNVIMAHRDEVERYVALHSDLGSLLEPICAKARQEFGPEAELALAVYKDPEVPDEYLTLYVRQASYAADVMDRIEAVASEFMTRLEDCSGHLLITTDFRRPEA